MKHPSLLNIIPFLFLLIGLLSCDTIENKEVVAATLVSSEQVDNFADYWYQGKAEVNSYSLKQARYGEVRNGDAVLVFVTEDFSQSKQVKLDYPDQDPNDKISVLKLNSLRKFKTGIYDYSMMESVFTPIDFKSHPYSLKTSTTSQDWCGHSFTQVNLKDDKYRITEFSYFESEGDKIVTTDPVLLEDEIWNRIRINPKSIPTGTIEVLPSAFQSRLAHLKIEPKQARLSIQKGEGSSILQLDYLHLERSLSIQFDTDFPHKILSWKEQNGRQGTTTGQLKETLKTAYWSQNSNQFESLRDSLRLGY